MVDVNYENQLENAIVTLNIVSDSVLFIFFAYSQEGRQYSVNLDKESRPNVVNLNVQDGEAATYYRDKASWSTWPEDLRNSSSAQTYVNISVSGVSSSLSSFAVPTPPPPPSVGPNASPPKPVSNCELAQSMSELSLKSKFTPASVTKKLDPGFLAELEKHLGEKEANKNMNASADNQGTIPCTNYARYSSSSLDKLRQDSPAQSSPVAENASDRPLSSIIPTLKPPPQGKSKSPVSTVDHRAFFSSSSTLSSKVQNSWQPKSTNVQRPRLKQGDQQRVSESATDAIVGQIWQQTQILSQQNICPADASTSSRQTPAAAQEDVNLLQEVTNLDVSTCGAQYDPSNIAKITFTQTQACSSTSQNYFQNTASINQDNIKLFQGATNVSGSSVNEARHGPCNVAKAASNQAQTCLSDGPNYPQGSSVVGQGAFSLLQLATNNLSTNSTNDSQYSIANVSKANLIQTQTFCSSQTSEPNYPHNASTSIGSFNLLRTTANYAVSANSATLNPWNCNIAKVTFNQACSSTSSYSQNVPTVNQTGSFTLHQNCLQNAPISPSMSNTHGITHIQNDLQHQQDVKSTALLSEQVYAELKQTVRKRFL